jgi:hypothetical protein
VHRRQTSILLPKVLMTISVRSSFKASSSFVGTGQVGFCHIQCSSYVTGPQRLYTNIHICKVEIPFNQGEIEKTMLVDGSNLGPAVASIVDSEVGVDLAVVHVSFEEVAQDPYQGGGVQLLPPVPRLKIKIKLSEPAKQQGNVIVNVCSEAMNLTSVSPWPSAS